jgi:hypothetical protein
MPLTPIQSESDSFTPVVTCKADLLVSFFPVTPPLPTTRSWISTRSLIEIFLVYYMVAEEDND